MVLTVVGHDRRGARMPKEVLHVLLDDEKMWRL